MKPSLKSRTDGRRLVLAGSLLFAAASLAAQTWTNAALPPSQRAADLLAAMTFSDETAMIAAVGSSYVGCIPANARLGMPAFALEDGPAGIADGATNVTALPAPIALGATWDVALARQYGSVLGAEAAGKGVAVLLGPTINMSRAYEWGRNFECFGEDPYLTGALVAAEVPGIQSQGVMATAKHFICYEEETDRMLISSDVDERTRREVYGLPFLKAVQAGAAAVMASYNCVNSRHACETEDLNAALKKQWGFNGWVMSDWYATFSTVAGMNNGMDMDMYCGYYQSNAVWNAIQSGNVPPAELDAMVLRILTQMFQFGLFDNPPSGSLAASVTSRAHARFALSAAAEGMVLLQNNNNLLPLPATVPSIAVIGSVAGVSPISTGAGSAGVVLPYNITPLQGISNRVGPGVTYAQGDGASVPAAVAASSAADVAIVCVGQQTSEGMDRTNLSLPDGQDALISAVAAANSNTIVVIYCSSAVLMPWAGQVGAIVFAWYPGQENGNALADVLFGVVNPSGKMPVSIPPSASQTPVSAAAQFPGLNGHTVYSEALQIGYRWYDANGVAPLFPFGCGLSYTTFGYSNLVVGAVSPSGQAQIGFDLSNTGATAGAEVAQLYLGFPAAAGEPPKLLKGFQRIFLTPGQTQHVTFNLAWEDLANWDATARGWLVTPGAFAVSVGSSSRDIRLTGSLAVPAGIPSSDLANAALHQSATASSIAFSNTPASAAVDGDTNTAWVSLPADPQWFQVDLGVIKDLSRVRLFWGTNYAAGYQIEISQDDTNWTQVYSATAAQGGVEDVLVSGRGRYVQVIGTQRAGPGGYTLEELDVFALPQQPYGGSPVTLPASLQAANYDLGGEGVGYGNTSVGNPGGVYRSDDVGIQATTDTGGGYNVGWLNNGEWLEYLVNPPDPSAIYNLSVRVASPNGGGQLRVRLDGEPLGGVAVPGTGGWQNWQTVVLTNIPIQGGFGSQALRLEVVSNGFNVNWIELDRVVPCSTNNIAVTGTASVSSLQAPNFLVPWGTDGDLLTRWSSAFSDPQWLEVDLGSVQNIARARVIWEDDYALAYSVQISSDNVNWTNLYSTTNGVGSVADMGALGTGRYVRLYATQRATPYGDSLWEFEIYPVQPTATVADISPSPGSVFLCPPAPFSFTVTSMVTNIPTNSVQLILNGIDVSPLLEFSGASTNWTVSFPFLETNCLYSYAIQFTDATGNTASAAGANAFDTFSQENLMIEGEDFDFGGGHFIDNPVPSAVPAGNSYYMEATPAIVGIDLTTPGNLGGEEFAYRDDSCGTAVADDFLRQKFIDAGVPDYYAGWWYSGAWLNYTRTFPTNNYFIYGRMASDNGLYGAGAALVTAGRGSSNQTTQALGTFSGVDDNWYGWQWLPLLNPGGQLAVVNLGGVQTLKMTSSNALNANFYLFVPAPAPVLLSASLNYSLPALSFPTQNGFAYMVVYKNTLADPYWKLMAIFNGDGTRKTVTGSLSAAQRYFCVVAQ